MVWLRLALVAVACATAHAQATAQSSVAPELRECYTDTRLLNRNNLPPTTMPVLIDIIRKIENHPDVNLDLRMLATRLLHTYRQDGIVYHQRSSSIQPSSIVLPYAPTFHSFHRHQLVLRMIPANQMTLPNNTLPAELKCVIHHILSTTVDTRVRGDESTCSQLSQLRALRTVRSIDDDVEIMDLSMLGADKNGQMQEDSNIDAELVGEKVSRQVDARSACPILTGVVNTRWGAVSAGNLIAGIAAGSESQRVLIEDLVKDVNLHYQNAQQSVSSIFPATLSGDLAEAVLIQGTGGQTTISVGNAGNWNSSQATRFYMLSNGLNLEMSDPEIRGGLDGLFLGLSLANSLNTFRTLKLSQLLDMYYSPVNGVFNTGLQACNRPELTQQYVTSNTLATETMGFVSALDAVLPLQGTIIDGLDQLITSAVNNFQTYTSSNLNDLTCNSAATTTGVQTRLRTNLYIILDASWQYQAVYQAISFLLDSIEVGQFGSSVTLLSAFDGGVLINQTFSLSDFHIAYTQAAHTSYMTGVNLLSSFTTLRLMMQAELRNETSRDYMGGNATVALFLLNSGTIENNANVYDQARQINDTVPDLRILFATASPQQDNLWNLVRDMHRDIIQISLSTNGANADLAMRPVLETIQDVGRRIINPTCGSTFNEGLSGQKQITEFVDPGFVNFYRIAPNYFYTNNENTRVRVSRSGTSTGNLIICHSRVVPNPRQGVTYPIVDANAITCETLTSATGNVEINLQNACDTSAPIGSCAPLFFSVEANSTVNALTATCTNLNNCRFPYDVAYVVQIRDLGCYSSSASIAASLMLLMLGFLLNMLRN